MRAIVIGILVITVSLVESCPQAPDCLQSVDGLYPHANCNQFYHCYNGENLVFSCPNGMSFDPVNEVCDLAENVECTSCELETKVKSTGGGGGGGGTGGGGGGGGGGNCGGGGGGGGGASGGGGGGGGGDCYPTTVKTTTRLPTTTKTTTTTTKATTTTTKPTTTRPTTTTTKPTTTTTKPTTTTTKSTTTTTQPTTTTTRPPTTTTRPTSTTTRATTTPTKPTTPTTKPTTTPPSACSPLPTCPSHGAKMLPYERDCRKYIQCIYGILTLGECPTGYHFSPARLECLPQQDAGCTVCGAATQASTTILPTTTKPTPTTTKPTTTMTTAMTTRLTTTPTRLTTITTRPPTTTTKPSAPACPAESTCNLLDISYLPYYADCSKYTHCFFGVQTLRSCPANTEFSPIYRLCVDPSIAGCPKCE